VKELNAKQFRQLGYLQEVNRRVLHPLGLAMFVDVDEATGEERLGGIQDHRGDPEGVYYGFEEGSAGYRMLMANAARVAEEWAERAPRRETMLGFVTQPISGVDP
jgi:hypothetical protein